MGREEKDSTSVSHIVQLTAIVGGGQTIGTLENGKKALAWGGLPGETVEFRTTKKKSKLVEGIVTEVISPSPERIAPVDVDSYLSTSPWQIMSFDAEQRHKAELIEQAFSLHSVVLPQDISLYSDNRLYGYRNKIEFSWFGSSLVSGDTSRGSTQNSLAETKILEAERVARPEGREHPNNSLKKNREASIHTEEQLDLSFFRRGGKGKVPVGGTSLAHEEINVLARQIRDLLQSKAITARQLKTLLIRCDQQGNCVWQLYTKVRSADIITKAEAEALPAQGGEIIYSDPSSPASRITERLATFGNTVLTDTIRGVPFRYATEGFFQVNLPIYEQALCDMAHFVVTPVASLDPPSESGSMGIVQGTLATETLPVKNDGQKEADRPYFTSHIPTSKVVDLYAGVGTIGLTIGGEHCTLVEIDEHAVREMKRNIIDQNSTCQAILAPTEKALDSITHDSIVIVDPPRAGLHTDVVERILSVQPPRIIYLSCNPVTQARDVALLLEKYHIIHHHGYNFFPRTPHIEHLVILDLV